MNKVVLCGRITADPDIKTTEKNGKELLIANFTVACNRVGGQSDFIRCGAFGRKAEILRDYFHKGDRINVFGSISTGSYTDKNGNKVFTTSVSCSEVEFVEPKSSSGTYSSPQAQPKDEPDVDNDGFMKVDEVNDEGLPFNL